MRYLTMVVGRFARALFTCGLCLAGLLSPAHAHPDLISGVAEDEELTEVHVFGKRRQDIGIAQSASEGSVSFARFNDRPLARPGELLEVVPGMAATQHSGSTKANQYFLRGFNLDHGTDFSVSLNGVPLNLRSHGHGQGYLDLNGVIPEVIETITYRKGPYYATQGDFSNTGGAQFETLSSHAHSFMQTTVGENGYGRLLGVYATGSGFLAADVTAYGGAYDNPDNLQKINLIGQIQLGEWSLMGLAYDARTKSTDQVPRRAIDSGLISRLGTIDTSDSADTSRYIVSLRRRTSAGLDMTLYAQNYNLDLYSNFTYALRDPVNGDQFRQADRRWIYGGSVSKLWPQTVAGFTVLTGASVQYDDIGRVGLYYTRDRQVLSTVRQDEVQQYSAALYAEAGRRLGPVRLTAGLRLDTIGGRVNSDDDRNTGRSDDTLLSPKFTAAWRLSDQVELYADAGRGFHSNDIRGATVSVTPGSDDPADAVDLLSPSTGAEIGVRYNHPAGLSMTAALWALNLDSELVYIGDGGNTDTTGASERQGIEVLWGYSPNPRLNIHLTAAASRARYKESAPDGGNRVPSALEYVVTGGISGRLTSRLKGTVTFRHLGPAALSEDNVYRSRASTIVNGRLNYSFSRMSIRLEGFNLLDGQGDDIQYFYTSRLPGEPAEGVDDYHVHPFEPRTFRLSLRVPL